MNFRALRDSFDFFHNSRRNLLAVAVIALVAYECAEIIIEDNLLDLYYFGLVILGIVGFLAIFKNWRLGLYGFVAWVAVEDLIRKYLGNNMLIYFGKDFIVISLYRSFIFSCMSANAILYRRVF